MTKESHRRIGDKEMALTRKFLAALGIEQEKIDEIIDAHSETVNALKEERDSYKKDAEKLPTVQQELDQLKAKPEDKYEKKYNDLKAAYETYKNGITEKETTAKKQAALRKLLKAAGISEKRHDSIIKVSDIKGIELDDSGNVKDSDTRVESLKKEWSDFITKDETHGAETPKPPKEDGAGGDGKSRAAMVAAKYYQNVYGGKKE